MKAKGEAAQAALLSAFVIPGAGQMFNGQIGKGLLIAVVFLAASLGFLVPVTLAVVQYYLALGSGDIEQLQASGPFSTLSQMWVSLITLLLVSIVLYVYSIWDAYHTRQKR